VIDIPTIDELRDTRRRLAEQAGLDVRRYAAMLEQTSPRESGTYVSTPLLAQPMSPPHDSSDVEREHVEA
jgi:hypothetical protein